MSKPKGNLISDTNAQSVLAGLIMTLVVWSGPAVLVFPVAQAAGLSNEIAMSWLWATAISTSAVSIVMSLATKTPVISTWSTPAIAFLLTALPRTEFSDAVGAFIAAGIIITLVGFVKPIAKLISSIPDDIAAALNAAILLPFGFKIANSMMEAPALVAIMVATYLIARRRAPRWAVALVLVAGVAATSLLGMWGSAETTSAVSYALTKPVFIAPTFSVTSIIGLSIPIAVLTLTGQFVPGFGVMRVHGYKPNPGPIMWVCGLASIAAAPFGSHSTTLGALITNMGAGPDAHEDRDKRYTSAVWHGITNLAVGLFAGTILGLMALLPAAAIATLAGLALVGAIASSFDSAFNNETAKSSLAPAAVLIVALSGIEPFGIGAAFWGITAGLIVVAVEHTLPTR